MLATMKLRTVASINTARLALPAMFGSSPAMWMPTRTRPPMSGERLSHTRAPAVARTGVVEIVEDAASKAHTQIVGAVLVRAAESAAALVAQLAVPASIQRPIRSRQKYFLSSACRR